VGARVPEMFEDSQEQKAYPMIDPNPTLDADFEKIMEHMLPKLNEFMESNRDAQVLARVIPKDRLNLYRQVMSAMYVAGAQHAIQYALQVVEEKCDETKTTPIHRIC